MSKHKQYIAPYGNKWAIIGPDLKDVISIHQTERAAMATALNSPDHKGFQLIFRKEPVVTPEQVGLKHGLKKGKTLLFGGKKLRDVIYNPASSAETQYRQILYPTLPPEIDEGRLKAAVKAAMAKTLSKSSKY